MLHRLCRWMLRSTQHSMCRDFPEIAVRLPIRKLREKLSSCRKRTLATHHRPLSGWSCCASLEPFCHHDDQSGQANQFGSPPHHPGRTPSPWGGPPALQGHEHGGMQIQVCTDPLGKNCTLMSCRIHWWHGAPPRCEQKGSQALYTNQWSANLCTMTSW